MWASAPLTAPREYVGLGVTRGTFCRAHVHGVGLPPPPMEGCSGHREMNLSLPVGSGDGEGSVLEGVGE